MRVFEPLFRIEKERRDRLPAGGPGNAGRNGRRGAGATHCAPGAARGSPPYLAELVGSGECAGDAQPRKKVGQAKCCELLVGGAGERALLLRRAAAGGCAGAPNLKAEKSPDNCRPRNPRCVLSDLRSETFSTVQTDLCWARTARDLWNAVVLVLDFRNGPVRDRA